MAILRAMLQKLSNTRIALPETEQLTATTSDLHSQFAPLWQLQDSRQLLEVIVNGHSHSYQSMILALDVDRKLLWMDDLFPTSNNLEIGDEITVRHHRNGEVLSFTTPVIAWGANFGAAGIAVILPDSVNYQPRRTEPRCDLSNHSAISAKIRLMGQEACFGTVKDLSSEGLCLMVPGNLLGQLHRDAIMPLCEVHLTNELHIPCRARIRSFRLCREPYRATRISLEFIDLQPKRRTQLKQFINRLTSESAETLSSRAA